MRYSLKGIQARSRKAASVQGSVSYWKQKVFKIKSRCVFKTHKVLKQSFILEWIILGTVLCVIEGKHSKGFFFWCWWLFRSVCICVYVQKASQCVRLRTLVLFALRGNLYLVMGFCLLLNMYDFLPFCNSRPASFIYLLKLALLHFKRHISESFLSWEWTFL